MHRLRLIFSQLLLAAGLGLAAFSSCSEIECPLDNVVMAQFNLYDAESGSSLLLVDTLYVQPAGRDTLLLNRGQGISNFLVPLRQAAECDTLLLHWRNTALERATDTLFVQHKGELHFESPDCPMTVFHTLRDVRFARAAGSSDNLPRIDSVKIVRTSVEYEDYENLKIFLRGGTVAAR